MDKKLKFKNRICQFLKFICSQNKSLFFLLFAFFLFNQLSVAQELEILHSGKSSLRGLSVISDQIIWACGSDGVILRTTNGGKSWQEFSIPNYKNAGFRDIHAFDSAHAIVMAIENPAMMFETKTSGRIWTKIFNVDREGMFLDAFDFLPSGEGILIGDPIKINNDSRFFIAETLDSGKNWRALGTDSINSSDYGRKLIENIPIAKLGEACFASSGTNILLIKPAEYIFISGGLESRLFYKNKIIELPILKGKETTGANSIAYSPQRFLSRQKVMIVGGNFNSDSIKNKNGVLLKGKNFFKIKILPNIKAYRSCVIFLKNKMWITTGPAGIEFTKNDGKTWKKIAETGFFAAKKSKDGNYVYFSGGEARVGRLHIK